MSSSDPKKPRPGSGSGAPNVPALQRPNGSASMFSSRARSSATPVPVGGAGARGPGAKPVFKPVIPVRRRPQGIPTPGPSSSTPAPVQGGASARGRGRGSLRGPRAARGAGGRGGSRPPPDVLASGPFALGTGAQRTGRSAGRGGQALSSPFAMSGSFGSGGGALGNTDLKPDPSRLSYRSPDKLAEREEYSDQEVEIIDMDDVGELDGNAPRSLPRMSDSNADQRKKKKKAKSEGPDVSGLQIKPDPEDEMPVDLSGDGTEVTAKAKRDKSEQPGATVADDDDSVEADEEREVANADALDLSESEEEEIPDDLVSDFIAQDLDDDPENRIYLFQFPSVFPKFVATEPKPTKKAAGSARRVAFAEDVDGKSGSESEKDKSKKGKGKEGGKEAEEVIVRRRHTAGTDIAAKVQDRLDDLRNGPGGKIGRLDVYVDGRAHLCLPRTAKKSRIKREEDTDMDGGDEKISKKAATKSAGETLEKNSDVEEVLQDLVLELTGGTQPSFLQHLQVRDDATGASMTLGEIHRKFVVTPELGCLLDDPEDLPEVKAEPGTSTAVAARSRSSAASGSRTRTPATGAGAAAAGSASLRAME